MNKLLTFNYQLHEHLSSDNGVLRSVWPDLWISELLTHVQLQLDQFVLWMNHSVLFVNQFNGFIWKNPLVHKFDSCVSEGWRFLRFEVTRTICIFMECGGVKALKCSEVKFFQNKDTLFDQNDQIQNTLLLFTTTMSRIFKCRLPIWIKCSKRLCIKSKLNYSLFQVLFWMWNAPIPALCGLTRNHSSAPFIASRISSFQKMSFLMTLNLACIIGPVNYVIGAGTVFLLAPKATPVLWHWGGWRGRKYEKCWNGLVFVRERRIDWECEYCHCFSGC